MRYFAKKLFKYIFFIMLLLFLFNRAVLLFYPSNDITHTWQHFYTLERGRTELLIVGNSHAYASFDPDIILEMTGKNSYILASNSQNIAQTYFNVKEALHYQHPDTIILEAFALDDNNNWRYGETFDKDWKKESNIDGMRLGLCKLEAVKEQYLPENWSYALLPIARCHGNWANIDTVVSNIFFLTEGNRQYSSFHPSVTSMSDEIKAQYDGAEYNPVAKTISETNIVYFHKLARLCREEDITLYLVMAPMYDGYIRSVNYDGYADKITELADSEGLLYLDCNKHYVEIGLTAQDFEDLYTSYHHLNKGGADKVTRFVLKALYND